MLETLFALNYYGGISLSDGYKLPVAYRQWYFNRLKRQLEKDPRPQDTETRALAGMQYVEGAHSMKRF